MRYAAIDIGTNSCRLLVAEIKDERINPLFRGMDTTRIGEGVNASGFISSTAMERTLQCLQRYNAVLADFKVNNYRIIATSAVREAENRVEFQKMAVMRVGMDIDIIKGTEEAGLSYRGVCNGLSQLNAPLVADLGGGSTEFIRLAGKNITLSLPVGAVRATEMAMNRDDIALILNELVHFKERITCVPLVFVGGTATSLVAIKLQMRKYRSELVHGQTLTRQEIWDIYHRMECMTLEQLKKVPGLQPERADIIVKGILIVLVIMDIVKKDCIIVSESDILEGIVWKLYEAEGKAL